jgi:hypothetical protein
MAIYPALFGHVDLPEPEPLRRDKADARRIGIRLVRLAPRHADPGTRL